MKRLMAWILFLLLLPAVCSAETLQAYVDRTRTRMDTPVLMTVRVPARGATVNTDGIRDFEVHARGTNTQVQIVNGRSSETQSFQFLLVPRKTGKLQVPALPVTWDGETRHTQPLSILVIQGGEDAGETDSGDISVESLVSDTAPYVTQQIIYTFTLRFGVQIANTQYTPPDFTGFTAKQIGEQQSRERVIAGRRYQEIALSYLLIPMKPGPITIGPATLRCDTVSRQRRNRPDFMDPFFSDSLFGNRKLTPRILRSKAISLKVRPLPPLPDQTTFSGLVGSFSMSAALEKKAVQVGDSATLSVTIQGAGNIMDAAAPEIRVPDAFKQYADSPQSEIQLGPEGYQGKKVFRLALVPVAPGNYEVMPEATTYFDPGTGRYQPLRAKPLSLVVSASDKPQEPPVVFSSKEDSATLPAIHKKKVDFTGRDILSIKTGLDALDSRSGPSLPVFLTALGLPVILFFLWMGGVRLMKKDKRPGALMAQKAMAALKKAAATHHSDPAAFLSLLYRSLVYAVCARADVMSESLTYSEARTILEAAGVSNQEADLAGQLLQDIDSARFGQATLEKTEQEKMLARVNQLVKGVLR